MPTTSYNRFSIILAFIALLSLDASDAKAWGKEGHEIVAEVAMHYLSGPAKSQVLQILRNISAADAGNWMDEMRSNTYYGYMRHWHYIDISKDSVYKAGQGDNLIAALNTAYNDLKKGHPNKEHRQEDLLILFHLLGDMHQPLHTGYPEDKGGNDVQVSYANGGGGGNLHHLWDTEIIQENNIDLQSVLNAGDRLSPAQMKSILAGNFVSWMYDSRSHLQEVYDFQGHSIDAEYFSKNRALVERQLFIGGIRLARVLESLFGATVKVQ